MTMVADSEKSGKVGRKRGRPSTNFDKRAYQRDYMRRRRAKAKLLHQGENGG